MRRFPCGPVVTLVLPLGHGFLIPDGELDPTSHRGMAGVGKNQTIETIETSGYLVR